ncbi:MAG: site-2 protease family protein [Acidimicrobiales bacterium]|jgi:Zn-dependent protease
MELRGLGPSQPDDQAGGSIAWGPSATGEGAGAPQTAGEAPPGLSPSNDASYWWPEEGASYPRTFSPEWGLARAPGPPDAIRPGSDTQAGSDSQAEWAPRGARSAHGARSGRTEPQGKPTGKLRRAWQRFISALLAVGAFLAKFGALLLKLKYIGLVLSMGISVVAYTLFFGWSFAVGFVLLIFVHEMGHVVVLRRQGVPASAPLFIPFLGAFVNMRQMPKTAYEEAVSGLAGPYFGTAASAVVAIWGNAVGSNFLLQLGAVGFLLNLFNLLPVLPLDGGRAAAALHPVLWLVGLVGLLVWELFYPSPIALIILVLGGFELYRRWTRRKSPAAIAYHALSARQRLVVASMYLMVVAVAVAGFQLTYVARGL